MIDSHCHLTYPQLAAQLPDVLARAKAAGVERMVTIGTDLDDSRRAVELCKKLPHVRCTVGVHPNHTADFLPSQMDQFRALQADPVVVAIGETGLDYHYDRSGRETQLAAFLAHLQLANEVSKPVVIHCREAVDDTLAVMKDFAGLPGVFHCFTGTLDEATRILAAGYFLGFTGPITFKKSDELREVVRQTPRDRLLVETDAPYLTPEPMRKQKINEPSFVVHSARIVAQLWGISFEEIDAITTANTERFYCWK